MKFRLFVLCLAALIALAGCGGGGGSDSGGTQTSATYNVNVVVTGLNEAATLSNGSDSLDVNADGTYPLSQGLATGSSYTVQVASQPTTQTCAIMNPTGVINGSNVDNIFINCAELTPESIVLSAAETTASLTAVAVDSLTFSTLPASLASVTAGDVIFSEQTSNAPDGILRKVVSVQQVNGQTVVQTESGVLTDVVKNGGFSYKGSISEAWAAANPQGLQVTPRTLMRAVTTADTYCSGKPSDFVFEFKDQPISSVVSISGCTGFNLDLDVGGKVSLLGKLESFRFIVDSTISQALSVTVQPSVDLSFEYSLLQNRPNGPIKVSTPLPIGPITIPASIEVDFIVVISGKSTAVAMVGAGAAITVKAGARLENDIFQIVNDFDPDFEVIGPEVSIDASVSAAIGPKISYKIAGAAGPEVTFSTPYLKLIANSTATPWWYLDAGVNATLALTAQINEIKGFGWLDDKWGLDYQFGEIFDFSRRIAEAQTPYSSGNSAPTAQFTYSPLLPEADQNVTFTNLSTDPDADTLNWYWDFGDGTSSTSKNPTHAYTAAGNYQAALEATDPSGDKHTETQTVTVKIASVGTLWYADNDGDGFGNIAIATTSVSAPVGYVVDSNDCNDADASIYPGAFDIPDDGIDQDCVDGDATTGVVNGTVTSLTGRVWMDRNLGASQVATAYNDSAAYGDLYQWGRGTDGHEKRTSSITTTLSSSDTPGHGSFILAPSYPGDWRNPQNDSLWQGVTGTNNPCPSGFRLPTSTEWDAERATWSTNDQAGAFASPLKLGSAGYRYNVGGSLHNAGSAGYYWSSSVIGILARDLYFDSGSAGTISHVRAYGLSARCLED